MADLGTLVSNSMRDGYFAMIAQNPLAQLGPPERKLLGAELLPEKLVEQNAYREEAIRFRSIIANAGSRYSTAQKKDGDLFAMFLVELGSSDIAREMTGRQYDALIRLLGRSEDMSALASMGNWADVVLNRALTEYNEKQRWEAIVNASVVRVGDNNYSETVNYANPAGHRVNAGGAWSSDTYDPFNDIILGRDFLRGKGYNVNRIITSTPVRSIALRNANVKKAVYNNSLAAGMTSPAMLKEYLGQQDLPGFETYDLQYRTQTGTGYFIPRNVLIMVATTGENPALDVGDNERFLSNVLGYTAVGRAAGQANPGRAIFIEPQMDKPPRIEGVAWQESLPVITEPESMYIVGGIS